MTGFSFDSSYYPYPSQRMVTYGKNGMVATSQPLAAQAGLDILKKGGNAIDAAIATAACLTVVEPTSNGIGGDAFAIVWTKGELHGLNASGPAPKNISIEKLKERGIVDEMPKHGFVPVTVPGAPSAWVALSEKFGKLPFDQLLEPAITYARDGYPISPALAYYWKEATDTYTKVLKGEEFKSWFDTFAPDGKAPKAGEIWQSEDHAKTLEMIAETKGEAFYRGELAEKIAAYSKKYDGFLTDDDLAQYRPEWVKPISVNYKGYDVWEIPPNGQGLVALMTLNILKNDEFHTRDDVSTYHRQIEAMKLAFADGMKYITERQEMSVTVEELLSDDYGKERRKLIGEYALTPVAGEPPKGGTVYLATADGEGNMVSFIQSNYSGFGSGLVVPGTGIALQNRGRNFSLDPNHDNALIPGKKTYHTIIPGFLTKDNEAVGPFGVMGAFMQPQGHVQVIMNTIDFKLNPQAALDAPRWQWVKDKTVYLEQGVPNHIANALASRGHDIHIAHHPASFGKGQIIWRDPKTGVLAGGTECRGDGAIATY